jgi:hypothetical protein
LQYSISICQRFIIPKTQHGDSLFLQPCTAFFIMLQLRILSVLSTIQLNSKFHFMTVKIEDVRTQRVLTAEFTVQQLSISQQPPKQLFRVCCAFA